MHVVCLLLRLFRFPLNPVSWRNRNRNRKSENHNPNPCAFPRVLKMNSRLFARAGHSEVQGDPRDLLGVWFTLKIDDFGWRWTCWAGC